MCIFLLTELLIKIRCDLIALSSIVLTDICSRSACVQRSSGQFFYQPTGAPLLARKSEEHIKPGEQGWEEARLAAAQSKFQVREAANLRKMIL